MSGAVRASDDRYLSPTLSAPGPAGGGEDGEGGVQISNVDFIAAVFRAVPDGATPAVCTKRGDPTGGGWAAQPAAVIDQLAENNNNYVSSSSFRYSEDGKVEAKKERFAACHFLLLDDVGSKVPLERLGALPPSWLLLTSPGNYQAGLIFAAPVTDGNLATRLHKAIIDAGLCDAGAAGPQTRWGRLPGGINGKRKYADQAGKPFQCRLVEWRPDLRYTPEDIAQRLGVDLARVGRAKPAASKRQATFDDDILTPRPEENPVVTALKARGLYKTPLGSGKHHITCPWLHEHTDAIDSGTAYFEPSEAHPRGGLCCQHSHRDEYHIAQLLDILGVSPAQARHKAVIRVSQGELHRVVDAAEQELARSGRYYVASGQIVSVEMNSSTGDPLMVATSLPALTRALSEAATWATYDKRANAWLEVDPPPKHVGILHGGQDYRHLKPLDGVARQPHFRESGGELVVTPGYDEGSRRFGVFDPSQFAMPEPSEEAARAALARLVALLPEFCFVADTDRSAALSAIFTAVARPTLAAAPAFHVRAPAMGSGKSYLCDLIGAFAGPGANSKVSYPTTAEEASKVVLALLLKGPAVIEFDDMVSDWIAHGVMNRMLTADQIEERILGASRTARVNTRVLFLGSGNNVGPARDLMRRVLTIHLDARVATPATLAYKGSPVDEVRKNRGAYVAAVLTIIEAWRRSGAQRAGVSNIATFGGAWSDYCRHPLIWLGLPDPATSLLEQVKHDPDLEAVGVLQKAWYRAFGSTLTTVRKAVERTEWEADLLDAMREFPIEQGATINRSKLGRLLKRHAHRIVDGLEFRSGQADGRLAWQVVAADSPPSPASPPSPPPASKSATVEQDDFEVDVELGFLSPAPAATRPMLGPISDAG